MKEKTTKKKQNNSVIINNDFPYKIPKEAGCKTPFFTKHPDDKSKRLYHTTIYSLNQKVLFGFLLAEISSQEEAFEIENTKEKYIIEIYNSGLMTRSLNKFDVANSSPKQIETLLLKAKECADIFLDSIHDKDYCDVAKKITIPTAVEYLSQIAKAIKQDFEVKKEIQSDLEFLDIKFHNKEDIVADSILVDRKFIHQANKALGGIEMEELSYLIDNDMQDEVDEVFFLAINSIARLHQMFKDYNNYGKDREYHIRKVSIKNELEKLIRSYSRTLNLKDKGITYTVNVAKINHIKIQTDFYILAEIIETVLSNAIEEVMQETQEFKTININIREVIFDKDKNREYLEISIEDNGKGFNFSRGAEKYFNLGYSTKTENTGLGLGIAKELIENMSGLITIENSCVLRGAKVSIFVPFVFLAPSKKLL